MDSSNGTGGFPVGGPAPEPARELKTDDVMVALVASLRFRIVSSWLTPLERGEQAS